jgi:hypothetical protein
LNAVHYNPSARISPQTAIKISSKIFLKAGFDGATGQ